jgi:hypothetical protein
MSTAFDITTSSQTSTIDLGSDTGSSAQGLHVKPDGTKFYVIDLTNTRVLQFAMSTAWDVSTASYESKLFSVSSQESSPRDVTFSEDGTKMYVVGTVSDAVFQYTLSTAWDVSTASYDSKSLDVSSEDTAPIGLDISRNGKNLVVGGAAGNDVNQYNLTTAFDVSTGSYSSTISTMNNGYFPALAGETDTTTKMYVTSNNVIRQYSVGGTIPTITSSPFTFTGLTNGTSYTFNVWAINPFGWSSPSDASGSVAPVEARIGLFFRNYTVQQINIASTGDATNFGTLEFGYGRAGAGAWGSSTRAFVGGGNFNGTAEINTLTYASGGSSTDYGDMNPQRYQYGALSNSTRGICAGGLDNTATGTTTIQYGTIASTGSFSSFGSLTRASSGNGSGGGSSTRGLFFGGDLADSPYYNNRIEYVTIASTGNAATFGNLSGVTANNGDGASNSTRSVMGIARTSSPSAFSNAIQYVTIASTGNAADFGDLTVARGAQAATGNSIRAVWMGGNNDGGDLDTIDYVTFSTLGNATDFGDLTGGSSLGAATSDSHGGLQ